MTDPDGREAGYFDALYAANPDPWGFATDEYEREKYAATLAALPRRRWAYGFEAGCSIGVFTRQLAARCDRLLAVDYAASAVAAARARCADLPNVEVARASIPRDWPAFPVNLVVLSEVLYFLPRADVERSALLARQRLAAGGSIVLVNWRGDTGTALSGDAAADLFVRGLGQGWNVARREQNARYRLDLVRRTADGPVIDVL